MHVTAVIAVTVTQRLDWQNISQTRKLGFTNKESENACSLFLYTKEKAEITQILRIELKDSFKDHILFMLTRRV